MLWLCAQFCTYVTTKGNYDKEPELTRLFWNPTTVSVYQLKLQLQFN